MKDSTVNIVCAVLLVFATAINVYAAVKLTRAEDKVSNIFCVEAPQGR
ncbi:hypothetical protein [Bradyrhizobium elkanii]